MTPLRPAADEPRRATTADAAAITQLLVDAFADDQMWGPWAFTEPDRRRELRAAVFRTFVDGALQYPWTWTVGPPSAACLWFPPGAPELSADQEQALIAVLDGLPPGSAERIEAGFDLIAAARPREPHYYLSLLGSAPAMAGQGVGLGLLQHTLALVDEAGGAAYLETSNHLVAVYERFGFDLVESFRLPDGPPVYAMWRPAVGERQNLRNAYSHGRSASGL